MSYIFKTERNKIEVVYERTMQIPEVKKAFTNFWNETRLPSLLIVENDELNAAAYKHRNNKITEVNSAAAELTEAELEALILHETCHHIKTDYNSRFYASSLASVVLFALVVLLSLKVHVACALLALPAFIFVRYLYYRVFMRGEHRADLYAARFQRAGMLSLLKKLAKNEAEETMFSFLSTHPHALKRVAHVLAHTRK